VRTADTLPEARPRVEPAELPDHLHESLLERGPASRILPSMDRNGRWIGAALVALGAALGAVGCSSGPEQGDYSSQSGAQLFQSTGCATCHGKDGRGFMGLAPSYAGLARYWTKDRLLQYIADPAAFAKADPRLGQRPMPAIAADVPTAARERLVEHVLTLMN